MTLILPLVITSWELLEQAAEQRRLMAAYEGAAEEVRAVGSGLDTLLLPVTQQHVPATWQASAAEASRQRVASLDLLLGHYFQQIMDVARQLEQQAEVLLESAQLLEAQAHTVAQQEAEMSARAAAHWRGASHNAAAGAATPSDSETVTGNKEPRLRLDEDFSAIGLIRQRLNR